jgi:hypothetical protein
VTIPLQIEYLPGGGSHDDLRIAVASHEHRADSCYLDLDRWPTAPGTTQDSLARLLDQWLDDLAGLGDGGPAFLPFDLSDQCSAWLRVSRLESDRVRVDLGWTSVSGATFNPADYGDTASRIRDFRPMEGAVFDADLTDLVDEVRTIRDGFRTE